ncbi:MAG TPA: 4-hydroxy-tetrahydrodipicolinate synthase [Polyangiaceae bacterium]|nr:4-hydroxy-tetrahydrodipicolinate synthase [Polyangiaceae bacterium]
MATTFTGTYTALVTPFVADGSAVDWGAFDRLVEAQIEGGVSGLVPCGSTGETPTLRQEEQREVVRRTVAVARGRVPVIAGTGTYDTTTTIEESRAALEAGATAVMIVMPYYNRPNQEGLFRHVERVAKAVRGPVVLYNIPVRTGVNLEVETLLRILDACENVVGLKDASGNVLYCQALAAAGSRCTVLSGDDALTVPMMSVGAMGVISVTSNLYPGETSAVTGAMLSGKLREARAMHLRLLPVHSVLFLEPNPAPIKAALYAKGRMTAAVRLPLVPPSEGTLRRILSTIDAFEGK